MWAELWLPQTMFKPECPVPQNVTMLGDRAFTEVIKRELKFKYTERHQGHPPTGPEQAGEGGEQT